MPVTANTLKEVRLLRGYSQEFTATKVGIDQRKYSRIERNPKKCPILLASEIANFLECDIKIFLN